MSAQRQRRQARRDERREELKQAAIEVFHEHGYHAARVSQIVKKVGVAQGTFYLYFEGKQQLFSEIISDFLEMVVTTVASWEPGAIDSREDLREELTRVGLMLTEELLRNELSTAIFFNEAMAVAPEINELIRHFYETLQAMLSDFNRILCQRGLIAPMDFTILASMTIGMVERVIMERVVYGTLKDAEPRAIVDHLLMHFLAGTIEPIDAPAHTGQAEGLEVEEMSDSAAPTQV
ncbi:TetR/AcrR family transcriptional regulator [Lujinxingia sediminis]|uniref:TetR/AcrR family transcriptional regulator n=1 Tax=Lujinxingia sediminis TaxID=2480984 RepID=A0ABY0CUG0_9DELT|nr:TetR/AcrR family transcriptional regulator [Lujinxingia sediminis]RVU45696.1 TetR/AcrR family transcriptional regulator [Lujinxingia sediminis]